MYGNVWEWCSDFYTEFYYEKSPEKDPTGPASGDDDEDERVLRGGSWVLNSSFARSACRSGVVAVSRYRSFGFRVVRELD